MLSVVGHPAAVNPDKRLALLAKAYSWPSFDLKSSDMNHPCLVTLEARQRSARLVLWRPAGGSGFAARHALHLPEAARGGLERSGCGDPLCDQPPARADPLYAKLRPGMKVTIAIDDISVPLPPMKRPMRVSAC